MERNIYKIGKELFITSDEEIKFNDYITDGYFVWQWKDDSSLLGRKKIILTTDKYLIKDGVQAVDDDFLEWFVKNQSFGNVRIEKIYNDYGETDIFDLVCTSHSFRYKIIIPSEEQNYILCGEADKFYKCVTCDSPCGSEGHYIDKPKQGMPEEAIKKYCLDTFKDKAYYPDVEKAIEFGVKWQQEQNIKNRPNVNDFDLKPFGYIHALTLYIEQLENKLKKSYSEDEVVSILYNFHKEDNSRVVFSLSGIIKWFEQFKKK